VIDLANPIEIFRFEVKGPDSSARRIAPDDFIYTRTKGEKRCLLDTNRVSQKAQKMTDQRQEKVNGLGKLSMAGKKRRKGQDLQPIQTVPPQQNGYKNSFAGSTVLGTNPSITYHRFHPHTAVGNILIIIAL
jgi:hypothetical protein